MTQTIKISYIGHLGDGVAEAEGKTIFVPNTAPGDKVALSPSGEWRLAEKGPNHAAPACKHYDICGGCNLQHIAAPAYLAAKREWVAEALARQGLEPPIGELAPLSPGTRRRASLSIVWDGSHPRIGYHAEKSSKVFALEECPVLAPAIVAALPDLSALINALLPRGRAAHAELTAFDNGIDVHFVVPDFQGSLRPVDSWVAIARRAQFIRVGINEELVFQLAPPHHTLMGVSLKPPLGGFLQAAEQSESILLAQVRRILAPAKKIADLYAGSGTFALPLAAEGKRVAAFEGQGSAIAGLKQAAQEANLPRLTTQTRDLQRRPLTAQELAPFDGVVIDPPRLGAEEQARLLAKSDVPRIAYVSCNPQSFARDARLLVEGGYELRSVQPVEQFLWSNHVELAAEFVRPTQKRKKTFHPRRKSSIA